MRLVVTDSREWTEPAYSPAPARRSQVLVEDVEAEAHRRLKAIKLPEWRTREFITGRPMPDDVRHLAMQIEFAASAISRLLPIPDDYDDDIYWPHDWGR